MAAQSRKLRVSIDGQELIAQVSYIKGRLPRRQVPAGLAMKGVPDLQSCTTQGVGRDPNKVNHGYTYFGPVQGEYWFVDGHWIGMEVVVLEDAKEEAPAPAPEVHPLQEMLNQALGAPAAKEKKASRSKRSTKV